MNASGTLLEGIALGASRRRQEALIERALALRLGRRQRPAGDPSHVDTCDPRLLAIEALLEVKRRVAPYLDLNCRLPASGRRIARPARRRKTETGVGNRRAWSASIPHFERTMADGALSVKLLFLKSPPPRAMSHALRRVHDPLSRHIETLASKTQRLGLQGR